MATTVVEGLVINIVDDNAFEMEVETTGESYHQGERLTIKIDESAARPLGHQYTLDFLRKEYLGRRVHCVVRKRDNRVMAIRVDLIPEKD
jgi:hypothetical protein